MAIYPKILCKSTALQIYTVKLKDGTEINNVNAQSKRVFHKHKDGCIIYHTHKGRSGLSYSNGCYTKKSSGPDIYCGEWERDDSANGAYCSGCGAFSEYCPGGYSHYETGSTVYILGCGKTANVTIDGYNCEYETDY